VGRFFAAVYNDKSLAGALHYALAKTAPDAIVEIARNKGYAFSSDELNQALGEGSEKGGGKLSDEQLAGVAGGAGAFTSLGTRALSTSLWSRFSGVRDSAFGLTIPGPSFVLVMSSEKRDQGDGEAEAAADPPQRSATELYDALAD
jgi:predicted ribosomally synthesized peptide with nif11-like leader